MKHWKYLDVARGIGLLLVIISHSCGLSPYLINYYIPLFFVVSGYLYKPGRSYGENMAHKASRTPVRRIKADQNISFRTGVAPSKHRIAVCLTGLWCSSKVKVPVMPSMVPPAIASMTACL